MGKGGHDAPIDGWPAWTRVREMVYKELWRRGGDPLELLARVDCRETPGIRARRLRLRWGPINLAISESGAEVAWRPGAARVGQKTLKGTQAWPPKGIPESNKLSVRSGSRSSQARLLSNRITKALASCNHNALDPVGDRDRKRHRLSGAAVGRLGLNILIKGRQVAYIARSCSIAARAVNTQEYNRP